VLLINFCISIGKLYGVALGYIFIEANLAETNWKLMMICGSFPNVIVLIGSEFILTESPRFLLANQRFEEGIEVLNRMITTNNSEAENLTEEEEEQITFEFSYEPEEDNHLSFKALFNQDNFTKTVAISVCWIIINFTFYGQLTIEALHISGPKTPLKEGLSKYFFTVFGELPSLFLTLYLIDHPYFGRKNSLILFFTGAAVFHLLFALTFSTTVGSIARFFMKDVFQVLYPLTTESFDTKIRTKGFGMCSGIGRLGSIVMPFMLIPLDEWSHASVYISFFGLSLLASFTVWKSVSETMNINLDNTKPGKLLTSAEALPH
jgi:MFS transporter, putative metabolite:H+ symporter